MVPSFPAPPAQPVSTATAAGHVYDSTAGPAVAASSVGALSGPWYVEEQHYQSYHKRMPFSSPWYFSHDPSNVSLSGQTVKYGVNKTDHLVLATITFIRKLEYENYATSSFYQPQKLTLEAQGYDDYGINYGTPTGYQFGAQATVRTYQPYIQRREATAAEISDQSWTVVSATRATNFGLVKSESSQHSSYDWTTPFEEDIWDGNYLANQFQHQDSFHDYSLRSCSGLKVDRHKQTPGKMGGGYTMAAEPSGISYFQDIVFDVFDNVCQHLTNCDGTSIEVGQRSRAGWYSDQQYDWSLSNGYAYPVSCSRVRTNELADKLRISWS